MEPTLHRMQVTVTINFMGEIPESSMSKFPVFRHIIVIWICQCCAAVCGGWVWMHWCCATVCGGRTGAVLQCVVCRCMCTCVLEKYNDAFLDPLNVKLQSK